SMRRVALHLDEDRVARGQPGKVEVLTGAAYGGPCTCCIVALVEAAHDLGGRSWLDSAGMLRQGEADQIASGNETANRSCALRQKCPACHAERLGCIRRCHWAVSLLLSRPLEHELVENGIGEAVLQVPQRQSTRCRDGRQLGSELREAVPVGDLLEIDDRWEP